MYDYKYYQELATLLMIIITAQQYSYECVEDHNDNKNKKNNNNNVDR